MGIALCRSGDDATFLGRLAWCGNFCSTHSFLSTTLHCSSRVLQRLERMCSLFSSMLLAF